MGRVKLEKSQKYLLASTVGLNLFTLYMYFHVSSEWGWWASNAYVSSMADFFKYIEGLDELYPVVFIMLLCSCVLQALFIYLRKVKHLIIPAIIQIICFLISLGYYFHGRALAEKDPRTSALFSQVEGSTTYYPVLWVLAVIIPSLIITYLFYRSEQVGDGQRRNGRLGEGKGQNP